MSRFDTSINWHAFNLGYVFRSNNYVLMEEPPAKLRNRGRDLMRWARRHDLPFRMPGNFPIKTSRALRGAIAMRRWDKEEAYIDAIFSAYWEQDIGNIGEYAALRKIAGNLDVDPEEFESVSESKDVREALIQATNSALARGVFGAPSIMIEDELYWGKDRMEFIEDHLASLAG